LRIPPESNVTALDQSNMVRDTFGIEDTRPFLDMREILGDDLPRSQVFVEQVGDTLQSLYDGSSKGVTRRPR
jgi:hypothetical protein